MIGKNLNYSHGGAGGDGGSVERSDGALRDLEDGAERSAAWDLVRVAARWAPCQGQCILLILSLFFKFWASVICSHRPPEKVPFPLIISDFMERTPLANESKKFRQECCRSCCTALCWSVLVNQAPFHNQWPQHILTDGSEPRGQIVKEEGQEILALIETISVM